jgi:hypothetical protein
VDGGLATKRDSIKKYFLRKEQMSAYLPSSLRDIKIIKIYKIGIANAEKCDIFVTIRRQLGIRKW